MTFLVSLTAILIFLYMKNRSDNKREERRARQQERNEALLEATLKQLRRKAEQEKNDKYEN